jgi:hypothetical protein
MLHPFPIAELIMNGGLIWLGGCSCRGLAKPAEEESDKLFQTVSKQFQPTWSNTHAFGAAISEASFVSLCNSIIVW